MRTRWADPRRWERGKREIPGGQEIPGLESIRGITIVTLLVDEPSPDYLTQVASYIGKVVREQLLEGATERGVVIVEAQLCSATPEAIQGIVGAAVLSGLPIHVGAGGGDSDSDPDSKVH